MIARLQALNPTVKFEIHTMTTVGDRVLNKSLPKIGEKSLFTKDLEDALRNGGVDFVVHSLKDLPTSLPVGMAIGAVLEREDPRDALVLNAKYKDKTLQTLPKGCVIGTSSLRRTAQLARSYSHLQVCDIRGNLNTRLGKLDADDSRFAGIILAQAGLVRMGWQERISQVLEPTEILYAVGQGALAVECRSNDEYILDMLAKLCHTDTQCRILAERSFLKTLGGGCSAPVAVCSTLKRKAEDETTLEIEGAVWSLDGKTFINDTCRIDLDFNYESPKKKARIESDEDNSIDTPDRAVPKKSSSPEVIDDTAAQYPSTSALLGGGDGKEGSMTVNKLIDIHGDLLKKCPHFSKSTTSSSSTSTTNESISANPKKRKFDDTQMTTTNETGNGGAKETGNGDAKVNKCPKEPHADFPVGQDFMGACPVFESTQEKVDAMGKFDDAKCPVIGETSNAAAVVAQCPFLSKQLEGSGDEVKLIEYDETQKIHQVPDLIDDSATLYCGMYRQKYVEKEIFQRCEDLGKHLANNLINLGALEVMKAAQNEIREKV